MANILALTDFESGEYTIPQDCYSDIQPYLDKYEKKYLIELLGCDLYALFIADLVAGVPQTQIYIDIFNEICEDNCGTIQRSEGMKTMREDGLDKIAAGLTSLDEVLRVTAPDETKEKKN